MISSKLRSILYLMKPLSIATLKNVPSSKTLTKEFQKSIESV